MDRFFDIPVIRYLVCLNRKYMPEKKSGDSFMLSLSAPARRALENKGILTPHDLAGYSKSEILKLRGMGPGSIPKLEAALKEKGLSFKNS